MKQKYQAYTAATQTVAGTRQIVMLYDGVIRFVQQAKEAIRERRIEDRFHLLVKASNVINGLQNALDFEKGGKVAKILYQYYASIDQRLFSIQHNNSLEQCDSVLADLRHMRDVWHEIDQGLVPTNEAEKIPAEKANEQRPTPPDAPTIYSA